jgi:hypothetical protein
MRLVGRDVTVNAASGREYTVSLAAMRESRLSGWMFQRFRRLIDGRTVFWDQACVLAAKPAIGNGV